MKRFGTCILVVSCLAACLAPSVSSAGNDRIAFLDIRMVGGEMTLEGIEVVEGRLKIPRRLNLRKGGLYCEVLDISGNRIFETVVPDPSRRRIEYADKEGRLHAQEVTVEDAFISIRIPYDESAHTIEIYRIDTSPGEGKLSKRAKRIGRLRIDVMGGGHEYQ